MNISSEDKEFFKKTGWLKVRNFYNKKDLNFIKKKLNKILKNASKKYVNKSRSVNDS